MFLVEHVSGSEPEMAMTISTVHIVMICSRK